MWKVLEQEQPEHENIVLVAVSGAVGFVRDLAWCDLESMEWENLKGEKVNVILWHDSVLPELPE